MKKIAPHFPDKLLLFETISGKVRKHEIIALLWLATIATQGDEESNLIEVGCHHGRFLLNLHRYLEILKAPAKITGIDWSQNHRLHAEQLEELPSRDLIGHLILGSKGVAIRDEDPLGVNYSEFHPISFCLINGDHTFTGVRRESTRIMEAMEAAGRQNSIIAWHAYENVTKNNWNGVKKYVDGLTLPNVHYIDGTQIAFRILFPTPHLKNEMKQLQVSHNFDRNRS